VASGRTTLVCADEAMRPRLLPDTIRRRLPELCPGGSRI
jgi:hypothetical protein